MRHIRGGKALIVEPPAADAALPEIRILDVWSELLHISPQVLPTAHIVCQTGVLLRVKRKIGLPRSK
jgi:hypothetical protein